MNKDEKLSLGLRKRIRKYKQRGTNWTAKKVIIAGFDTFIHVTKEI